MTAANPGIPDGGTVGESKFDILSKLPADCVIPALLVPSGRVAERVARVHKHIESTRWDFPVVVKPDVGQRGAGVKLARNMADVKTYLSQVADPVVVQPYHPGPFEAGVFYYRLPGRPTGWILSITDKHFPVIVGDGVSTVEELIWAHPRYRLQADTFLARHSDSLERVPDFGERLPLGMAGNHCQGTLFLDGRHLITPALERRIDEIARTFDGFFVGRFDIRYADLERFRAGTDLAIVELNGATAESTNIYDPHTTLIAAYRQLFRHFDRLFNRGGQSRGGIAGDQQPPAVRPCARAPPLDGTVPGFGLGLRPGECVARFRGVGECSAGRTTSVGDGFVWPARRSRLQSRAPVRFEQLERRKHDRARASGHRQIIHMKGPEAKEVARERPL
jgi:RimK-like ATP-grasp domain